MEYLAVIAGPLVITGMILYINARSNVDEIKENWVKYRCNPMYMPFSSMFDEENTTSENFSFCTNAFAKQIFSYASDPVYNMFGMLTNLIRSILGNMNQFLAYLAGMTNFILNFANQIFGKIFNSVGILNALIGKIRDLFQRIIGSAYYAAFVAQTAISFIISIFQFSITLVKAVVIMLFALSFILALFFPVVLAFVIPLGAMVGITYCFHPDTVVSTQRGMIKMKDVIVGDIIEGSSVTAKFDFICNSQLYVYNGVIVSGNHIVLHNDRWMYVSETGSPLYDGPIPEKLVCFNTDDNIIRVNGTQFRDYEEIDDETSLAKIGTLISAASGTPMLHPLTFVEMQNGWNVPIYKIRVGDILREGKVSGIVRMDSTDTEWYLVDSSVVSADQPILTEHGTFVEARWIGKPYHSYDRGGYQIFIDNGTGVFTINNELQVRDYPDSHEPDVLNKIQSVVLDALNA